MDDIIIDVLRHTTPYTDDEKHIWKMLALQYLHHLKNDIYRNNTHEFDFISEKATLYKIDLSDIDYDTETMDNLIKQYNFLKKQNFKTDDKVRKFIDTNTKKN